MLIYMLAQYRILCVKFIGIGISQKLNKYEANDGKYW